MKYLKLFEDYNDKQDKYYFEISSNEFLFEFIDNNIGTLTESELKSINDLGYNFQIKNSSFVGKFYHHDDANTTLQFFIAPEEWFYVSLQNQSPGQKYIAKYYKCDQFDGLLKFLRNYIAFCIVSNKKKWFSENYLTESDKLYQKLNFDQDGLSPQVVHSDFQRNRCDISLSDYHLEKIKSLFKNCQYKIVVSNNYKIANFELNSYSENRRLSFTIQEIKDSYFIIRFWMNNEIRKWGLGSYYKCDQFDGIYQFLKDYPEWTSAIRSEISNNRLTLPDQHVNINENLYYVRDNPHEPSKIPPGSKEGEVLPNDISDSDINFIKKELGIDTKTNIIKREFIATNPITNSPVQIVTYYIFYYNMKGEVGNLNTMSNTRNQDIRLVHVYSYTNEWFKVRIDDRLYWCDQVDAVVKCVQDSIDKDVFYNNINESINTEITEYLKLYENINTYYQSITTEEFNEYSYRIIDFDETDKQALKELDKHNGYSFKPFLTMCFSFNLSYTKSNITGNIYKIKDEWFLIEVNLLDEFNFSINKILHYKCDQIDGLIHFLKTIKNKI